MRRLLALLLPLSLAASARATDGIIEINAAQAVAGGVTPGDAPGYPVQITRPGSYRLTSNLDVSALAASQDITAISIETTDVHLDLGGFAIIGPTICGGFPYACVPTGSGIGVRSSSNDRVSVRNGTIRGLGNLGIQLGADASIDTVNVSNCGHGGVIGGTGSLIARNRFVSNGGPGISITTGVVSENVVRASMIAGISASSGATIVNNTVTQTQPLNALPGVGISVGISSGVVMGNTVAGNQGLGLSLSPTTGFYGNTVTSNNGAGNPPQTSGGIQLGPNVCGNDTTCP